MTARQGKVGKVIFRKILCFLWQPSPTCIEGRFLEVVEMIKISRISKFVHHRTFVIKGKWREKQKTNKMKTFFASILIPNCVLSKNKIQNV